MEKGNRINVTTAVSGSVLLIFTSYSLYTFLGRHKQQRTTTTSTETKTTNNDNDTILNYLLKHLQVSFPSYSTSLVSRTNTAIENEKQQQQLVQKGTADTRQKRKKICPFSSESNFVVEVTDNVPITPMEIYDEWIQQQQQQSNDGKDSVSVVPLSARWLNAGMSGQDTPGLLRAGLKRLADSKYFILLDPTRIREELLMKAKAFDNPVRYPSVYVYEEDSIPAQEECLELFINYLPKRYPDMYQYDEVNNTLHVVPINETFIISEWMGSKALELCERIVQEDLILMRPSKPSSDSDKGTNTSGQHFMAAAAVVFSFNELQQKLGQPMTFIHMPVPRYESDLRKTIDITFSKLLKDDQIMWRNNWGIDPFGVLDEPLYGSVETQQSRTMTTVPTIDEVRTTKHLKVEYQTIRRLPKSRYILFTVKSMVDPLCSLEHVPNAAKSLAQSIRCMSPEVLKYKGINDIETRDVILSYLESIE